jgi:hypothetical protein
MRPAAVWSGLALLLVAAGMAAEPEGKPTVVPAVLRAVTPTGAARGQPVVLTLEGARLAGSMRVFFDDPAISGEMLAGGEPKNADRVQVRAVIGSESKLGVHRLFLQTPLGTTSAVSFAVGGWPETAEKEPNDPPGAAQPISLPTTVTGTLEKSGDVDSYRFETHKGQEIVCQVLGSSIRSKINAVLTLTDARGRVLAMGNGTGSRPEPLIGYKFLTDGTCVIQVRDFENAGGADVYYRLNVGEFPAATAAFPLGLRRGTVGPVALQGFNLGSRATVSVRAPAAPATWGQSVELPGEWLAAPRLAVGEGPELLEKEPNDLPAGAQPVPVPITVNGRIHGRTGACDADLFRFRARRGQTLVLEVAARRLGSPLDSLIEVLDLQGRPIERATIRPVAETSLVLSNRDSTSGSFRIQSWNDLAVNDYAFAGRELLQITRLPGGPDEDVSFRSFRGPRIGLLDTTPEAHSIGTPLYKVQVYPPGRTFPPNGMPLFHIYYQNDDGGVLHGKDSRLTFDPPADGEYLVRVTDVRGQQGPDFAYRLSIHPLRPDYRLTLSPEHPNLPRGSRAPVTVGIERYDDFGGPVEVRLEGLPAGFSSSSGVIAAGADSATLTLAAGADASTPALPVPSPIRVVGRAKIEGREVLRTVEPEKGVRLITVLPEPDIGVTTDVRQVTLRPGGTAEVVAHVQRRHGYKGRVPIEVQNLPFGVQVRDVGLNGVLITEQQTSRKFVLVAAPWARPQTRPFFAVGRVESDPASEVAAEPIVLTIVPDARQARR